MFRKKQFYDKEMECPICHKKDRPILEKNNINFGMGWNLAGGIGRVGLWTEHEKKYLLICPNCKAIIGTK